MIIIKQKYTTNYALNTIFVEINQNMKRNIFIIVLLMTLGLVSCNENKESAKFTTNENAPLFVGEWLLESMKLGDEVVNSSLLGNPTYVFNIDKTYVIHVGLQIEEGKWTLNNNKLKLVTNESKKETVLKIIENTEKSFVYEVGDNTITKVVLKRLL